MYYRRVFFFLARPAWLYMASHRGSGAIITLGGILLIGALSHHAGEAAQVAAQIGPAIALLLDGGLAISLIAGGWWVRYTDMTSSEERSVAIWTVLGGLAGAGISGLMILVFALEGRPVVEPGFSILVHTGSGAAGLFLAGAYASRKRAVANRFETLFNNTLQFAGLLDPDGTVIEVNETALDFGGFDRSEVVGRQFQDVPWWTHSEAVHERVQDAIDRAADGEVVRYETEVQGVDGLRRIDFSVKPVVNDRGQTTRIIVEGLDITDKTQQRQQLQVLHRVMRHNMRNDVTKLRGWTQRAATASTQDTRKAAADRVSNVLDSWEKMSVEIKQIQEEFRSDSPASDSTPDDVPLSNVIDAQQAAYPDAEFEVDQPDPPVGRIPQSIEKAVAEAINNAVESNATETPTVSITVERSDNDWLNIHITDNGPGMPEAEATVLETGEETPLTHGKGLGVWKIRMLTKQVGGDVSVSTDTDGTKLSLKLPDRPSDQAAGLV